MKVILQVNRGNHLSLAPVLVSQTDLNQTIFPKSTIFLYEFVCRLFWNSKERSVLIWCSKQLYVVRPAWCKDEESEWVRSERRGGVFTLQIYKLAMKRCFGIRSSNQRFIIRCHRVMYEPGVDVAQQASGRPGSSNTDHPCGGLDGHVWQNTSLARFEQKYSFVLPSPRKWHFPARHDEDILGKCRFESDEAAKVLINGLKADGWLSPRLR